MICYPGLASPSARIRGTAYTIDFRPTEKPRELSTTSSAQTLLPVPSRVSPPMLYSTRDILKKDSAPLRFPLFIRVIRVFRGSSSSRINLRPRHSPLPLCVPCVLCGCPFFLLWCPCRAFLGCGGGNPGRRCAALPRRSAPGLTCSAPSGNAVNNNESWNQVFCPVFLHPPHTGSRCADECRWGEKCLKMRKSLYFHTLRILLTALPFGAFLFCLSADW